MVNTDSDDYELMPSHELDDLRHEVSILKKGSLTDGDKAKALIESVDRLTISVNRLITILDDAQKDIIEEYQESKPAEKLNQLLEQNDTIAKALLAISENFGSKNTSSNQQTINSEPFTMPAQTTSLNNAVGSKPAMSNSQMQNSIPINRPMPMMNTQQSNSLNNQQQFNQQFGQQQSFNNRPGSMQDQFQMNPPPMMDDLPPLDALPPLNGPSAVPQKKKFLGIM